MKYAFDLYKTRVDGHEFWVVESKDLKGCIAQGDSPEEALKEYEINENEWIEAAMEFGIPIPEPSVKKMEVAEYSGKFTVRVSPFTHKEAAMNARELGISLNQYVNDAIVDYNARERCTAKEFVVEKRRIYNNWFKDMTYGKLNACFQV